MSHSRPWSQRAAGLLVRTDQVCLGLLLPQVTCWPCVGNGYHRGEAPGPAPCPWTEASPRRGVETPPRAGPWGQYGGPHPSRHPLVRRRPCHPPEKCPAVHWTPRHARLPTRFEHSCSRRRGTLIPGEAAGGRVACPGCVTPRASRVIAVGPPSGMHESHPMPPQARVSPSSPRAAVAPPARLSGVGSRARDSRPGIPSGSRDRRTHQHHQPARSQRSGCGEREWGELG
mmetsp:Transcript_17153/g.53039  ORF Transcript_17153/g.53039 Transcript_17153/m.53039 type:complete len:229 (+) Transcript_17153:1450-2136(+)